MKTINEKLIALLLALITTAGSVVGQFPGDVFFDQTSVVVAQGADVPVKIQTFVGSERLGAVAIVVSFDPAELEVLDITAGDDGYAKGTKWTVTPNQVRVTVVKASDVAGGIGTLDLAEVRLRPLGSVGSQAQVAIAVEEILDVGLSPYASATGFSLQVGVGAATSALRQGPIASSSEAQADSSGGLRPLRRMGSWVETHVFDCARSRWIQLKTLTRDPAVGSDYR